MQPANSEVRSGEESFPEYLTDQESGTEVDDRSKKIWYLGYVFISLGLCFPHLQNGDVNMSPANGVARVRSSYKCFDDMQALAMTTQENLPFI